MTMSTRVHPDGNPASIGHSFSATVDHTKAYLGAEKTALTLRAKLTAKAVGFAVAFGVAALVLVLFAFGWLLVGLALLLAEAIGAIGAALVVGVVLLIVAAVCGLLAKRALSAIPRSGS